MDAKIVGIDVSKDCLDTHIRPDNESFTVTSEAKGMNMDFKPILTGARVTLNPLLAGHRSELLNAANDGELWKLKVTHVPDKSSIDSYLAKAIHGRKEGTVIPFVIVVGNQIVGSTRFWKFDYENRNIEIGHTWIAAGWQRSFVNTEAKFLMLRYAFETLGLIRVQFTTDELNAGSRAAISRLGAFEEGLIRNERIMPDGRKRNSVRYSITDDEWPLVKAKLISKISQK